MPLTSAAIENRISTLELKQAIQANTLDETSKILTELKTKQEVQTEILTQHTNQNSALLRDQRQVITTVATIEAIIKTGSVLGAMIKWIAGIAMASVTLYALYKMIQSGDFSAVFKVVQEEIKKWLT